MIHLILIILCISLAEFFIRSKFFIHLHSLFLFFKKLIWLMPNKKISDHWKELIIPVYALMMMINSLKIILILSFIIFSFISLGILTNAEQLVFLIDCNMSNTIVPANDLKKKNLNTQYCYKSLVYMYCQTRNAQLNTYIVK